MSSLTNEELADLLDVPQVEPSVLHEAATRLRRIELEQLLASAETVGAIYSSTLIDRRTAELIEPLILQPALKRQSSSKMSSLASRIMNGEDYVHADVLSLAASVMSQDETQGQR